MNKTRCGWVSTDPLYIDYHDNEWGKPIYDNLHLFEMICLEGQQAGLSWITVLKKREGYRKAFYNFIPEKIIQMTEEDVDRLVENPEIIRSRSKINTIIRNAHAYLNMQKQGEDFSEFIWSFAPKQAGTRFQDYMDFPTQTEESAQLSKALKKKGFNFVGPTICYAFMQAAGLVNDHVADCFCITERK